MDDSETNSNARLDSRSSLESLVGSIHQLPQPGPLPSRKLEDYFAGWKTIDKQRDFYDERDCLDPSHHLVTEKLKDRTENDVVIFDYSLDPDYLKRTDGHPPVKKDTASSGNFSEDDDIFFQVPKNELIESKQFDQIINPLNEPRRTVSRGPRLGVIDFPQCYDTYDESLLYSMGEKLGLLRQGETSLIDAHSQRVRELPGSGRFRTGISFRVPLENPGGLSTSGSLEDRFILFVSFPYFGKSNKNFTFNQESESVGLVGFKRLEADVPGEGVIAGAGGEGRMAKFRFEVGLDRRAAVSAEERDIEKILVHQARYMIFDNYTMAIFRSKEDGVKGQVPLHRFQQRIGAFRAMIHMIANRMNMELWIVGKLRAFLSKLEEDIDRMIFKAGTYEDSQEAGTAPDGGPLQRKLQPRVIVTKGDRERWRVENERAQQDKVRERKQGRVRDLLTSLNNLGAALLAVIRVSERQIAVLQDLHTVFSTSYLTKTQYDKKGYPSSRNPFYRSIVPIPVLLENPGQIWPGAVDTIDQVIQERKSFVKEVKELMENMEIRRKSLFGFLKSDLERMAQESAAMERTEALHKQQVQQAQILSVFTVVATAFLPLSFCTSYFGMNNIKEFNENPLSRRNFWLITGPVCAGITLLAVVIISWGRLRAYVREIPVLFREKRGRDIEA